MSDNFHENTEDDFEEEKSRTQIKKEMEALQAIGRKLTELSKEQLKDVPMSEDLEVAIRDFSKMPHREAKRRHLQFIGKLMRAENAEAIQQALDKFDTSSKAYAQELHRLEAWRTRLINEGNTALTDFVEEFPQTNVQQIRQLIRNAQKDIKNNKNTGAAKKLFQHLRDASSQI